MIYFLHGTDTYTSRARMHDILQNLYAKRPQSEVFKLTTENWSESQFDELIASFGLFEKKYIVVLDFLLSSKDIREYIAERLSSMQEAEHWFVILDGKLDASLVKKIEQVSYKTQLFEKKEIKKDSPIIFSITDKLYARDKKKLWVCLVDLINQGVPVEEIHGVIFWAVKNMILSSRTGSQNESGLAPFPYSKALSGSRSYTLVELQKMSADLVDMVHKVRTGEGDMEIMLEKWVLEV